MEFLRTTAVISQNFKCAVFWEEVSGYARKNQESRLNNGATKAASRGSVRTDDSPGQELGCSTNQAARS
jgi:hypothetical protein